MSIHIFDTSFADTQFLTGNSATPFPVQESTSLSFALCQYGLMLTASRSTIGSSMPRSSKLSHSSVTPVLDADRQKYNHMSGQEILCFRIYRPVTFSLVIGFGWETSFPIRTSHDESDINRTRVPGYGEQGSHVDRNSDF